MKNAYICETSRYNGAAYIYKWLVAVFGVKEEDKNYGEFPCRINVITHDTETNECVCYRAAFETNNIELAQSRGFSVVDNYEFPDGNEKRIAFDRNLDDVFIECIAKSGQLKGKSISRTQI